MSQSKQNKITKLIRLYVPDADLVGDKNLIISGDQWHYLRNVMRVEAGQHLRLFNGRQGEFVAEVIDVNKKNIICQILYVLAEQKSGDLVTLMLSPIKKENLELVVEKASELGAAEMILCPSERTVHHRYNSDRLQAIAIEAAEQSERMDILTCTEAKDVAGAVAAFTQSGGRVLLCAERVDARPLITAVEAEDRAQPVAVLVGPEGGFTPDEINKLSALPGVVPVTLGRQILRAETASIAALAIVQAARQR